MNPLEYCRDLAAPIGSEVYYAIRFSPREIRDSSLASLACSREILNTAYQCSDQGVARLKLDWWRQEFSRLKQQCPEHPATTALQAHLPNIDLASYQQQIDAALQLWSPHDFSSHDDVRRFLEPLAGAAAESLALANGEQSPQALQTARELGIDLFLSEALQNIRRELSAGRLWIDQSTLQQSGVDIDALLNWQTTDAIRDLLHRYSQQLRATLQSHTQQATYKSLSPLRIQAALHIKTLQEIERSGCRFLEEQTRLTPLHSFWIAWRSRRA